MSARTEKSAGSLDFSVQSHLQPIERNLYRHRYCHGHPLALLDEDYYCGQVVEGKTAPAADYRFLGGKSGHPGQGGEGEREEERRGRWAEQFYERRF